MKLIEMPENRPLKNTRTRLSFELWIHRIPDDLRPPLPEHLQKTYEVWKRVVDARVCWRVTRIDAWNYMWIDVRFKNEAGKLEDHSLAIYEDCCEKIESAPYYVEREVFLDGAKS